MRNFSRVSFDERSKMLRSQLRPDSDSTTVISVGTKIGIFNWRFGSSFLNFHKSKSEDEIGRARRVFPAMLLACYRISTFLFGFWNYKLAMVDRAGICTMYPKIQRICSFGIFKAIEIYFHFIFNHLSILNSLVMEEKTGSPAAVLSTLIR